MHTRHRFCSGSIELSFPSGSVCYTNKSLFNSIRVVKVSVEEEEAAAEESLFGFGNFAKMFVGGPTPSALTILSIVVCCCVRAGILVVESFIFLYGCLGNRQECCGE